jgi:hypothetical protein
MGFLARKIPGPGEALPGRSERMRVPEKHFVLGTPLEPPFPDGLELALFGMGCFWGAEKESPDKLAAFPRAVLARDGAAGTTLRAVAAEIPMADRHVSKFYAR